MAGHKAGKGGLGMKHTKEKKGPDRRVAYREVITRLRKLPKMDEKPFRENVSKTLTMLFKIADQVKKDLEIAQTNFDTIQERIKNLSLIAYFSFSRAYPTVNKNRVIKFLGYQWDDEVKALIKKAHLTGKGGKP